MLEDTRWFVFALIVSPNRPGHYFVGGNDPVCLVSKERQDAESWSLRKTTIGLICDDKVPAHTLLTHHVAGDGDPHQHLENDHCLHSLTLSLRGFVIKSKYSAP